MRYVQLSVPQQGQQRLALDLASPTALKASLDVAGLYRQAAGYPGSVAIFFAIIITRESRDRDVAVI